MKIPLFVRIKSLFARDKHAFWWREFTDYELSLSRMTLSELADELERTQVRHETSNSIIVEHMLAARLARIQSRASWWSGWLGFAGAILAVAIAFYLGQLSNNTPKVVCAPCCKQETQTIQKPIQTIMPTLEQNAPKP